MRKRRRLANKMTIMVCAVLIAVSAFFYVPMEVSAEASVPSVPGGVSGIAGSQTTITSSSGDYKTLELKGLNVGTFSFDDSLDDDSYYIVTFSSRSSLSSSKSVRLRNYLTRLVVGDLVYIVDSYYVPSSGTGTATSFESSGTYKIVGLGSDLKNVNVFADGIAYIVASSQTTCKFTPAFYYYSVVVETIAESDALALQNAYNSGYSSGYADGVVDGEDSGYSSGYSDGYSDGQSSVDTDSYYDSGYQAGESAGYESGYQAGESAGYESGFQSGADSVDTQSYYDAGYQAGYALAYDEGYDTGYEEAYDIAYENGYQSAMDRIASWGADTSDYPILVDEFLKEDYSNFEAVFDSDDLRVLSLNYWVNFGDESFDPFHVYKIVLDFDGLYYDMNENLDTVYFDDISMRFNFGSYSYPLSGASDAYEVVYIPGDRMSNTLQIVWNCINARVTGSDGGEIGFIFDSLKIELYDMGPSGDTQNHIANQTDQLTNGYDTSSGDSANSSLSTGLNEFETAENSLFATAATGMKDFTFFDFESVPAMLTAVTFITSIMGSWFEQAGGASGVGIVLSILFSVMLVSMVLGLYRLYQSAGHRAEARERHRESMERWKKGK